MGDRVHFEIDRYPGVGFGCALAANPGGDRHRWCFALVLPFVGLSWWFWRRPVAPWDPEWCESCGGPCRDEGAAAQAGERRG